MGSASLFIFVVALVRLAPMASSTDAYLLTLEKEREMLYDFRAERSYHFEAGTCKEEYFGGRRKRQLLQQADSGIGGLATWSIVAPISIWDGLEFHSDGHVSDIMLACFDITGSLPAAWSKLDLEAIEMRGNSMDGDLPRGWSTFSNLTSLDLSANMFKDKLPEQWSSLTSLKQMSLAENKLSGGLPQVWSSLENLEELHLGGNPDIGGQLPSSWQHLSSLRSLDLRSMGLTGQVPLVWTRLGDLQALRLGGNHLSGALERSWKAFANMTEIDLSNNQLTGPLPREWSMLSSLDTMDLGGNMLHGTIPEEWSMLTGLRRLRLSGNKLTGEVPHFLSVLSNLVEIDLSNNSFTGFLPKGWSALSMAEEIKLDRNMFIGVLPVAWQILQLRYLDVSHNYLFDLVSLTIMAADKIEFQPQLPTATLLPPPPPSPALPPSPPPSPNPPPPFPPLPSNVYGSTNGACGKDRIQAELEDGNFDECLQLGANVSSTWKISTTLRCCKSLATLQEDQCLCDAQFFLTRVDNFTEATAHTIHRVAKAACGMPLDCSRPPPPPPPSPPPSPPVLYPPPIPPSPPPPVMTALPTLAPSDVPTLQPTMAPTPAPSPIPTVSPTPQPTPVPTVRNNEGILRKDFQALVLFTSASNLFRAPADLTQEELSLLRTAVSNALPILEEKDVQVLGANRTGTDAVVFEFSVTLRSSGNDNLEEVWSGFQSAMLRRGLTEAGITDVVWVSLTGDGYFDIGGGQSKGDIPTAAFLLALGILLGTVLGCCTLDFLRSRGSCGAERCSNPQHLELLLPALALSSIVATAAYAAAELSDGLLYMTLGTMAATVVFNMIGLYYFCNIADDDETVVWVHAVSTICAVIHIGTLKFPTCGVASWCSMPITQQRYNSLALLGLASSLLGSGTILAVVITNQQEKWEWSSLAQFTLFSSLGILLVCIVAVLRCLIMPVSGRVSDRTRPYSQLEMPDADNTKKDSSPGEFMSGDGMIPANRTADQQGTTSSEPAAVKGDAMDDEEAGRMKSPFEPMPYK